MNRLIKCFKLQPKWVKVLNGRCGIDYKIIQIVCNGYTQIKTQLADLEFFILQNISRPVRKSP